MGVRPLSESDLPQVAELYWRYMRRRNGTPPPALLPFFRELYFTNPFSHKAIPALVYEDKNGRIGGFLGPGVRRMSLCGQPLRVVYGGNLVVHPEFRSGLAAPRLIGAMVETDHDISMTDSANDISRKVLERMGFRTVPVLNIHWRRLLRPAHYAIYGLRQATGPALSTGLKMVTKPFCALADGIAAKLAASPFRQKKPRLQGSEPDIETLLRCFSEFRNGYSLWTEYDAHSLQWLLSFMERRPSRGNLRKVLVRDEDHKIVGWYIYYVKPAGVGEVVQVGGDHKFTKEILDHLFYDAWERGVAALHGVVDHRRMADFSDKGCFFTCRGGWTMAKPRKPEHLEVLERGDMFYSRLDGEWCLDPGD